MIDLANIIEKSEHALYLLDTVAAVLPAGPGLILKTALSGVRAAFNAAGVRSALLAVQEKYSAEAQAIADASWPSEPTKPE